MNTSLVYKEVMATMVEKEWLRKKIKGFSQEVSILTIGPQEEAELLMESAN